MSYNINRQIKVLMALWVKILWFIPKLKGVYNLSVVKNICFRITNPEERLKASVLELYKNLTYKKSLSPEKKQAFVSIINIYFTNDRAWARSSMIS